MAPPRKRVKKDKQPPPQTADAVVARQVTTLRKRQLLTQEQLAERLGTTQSVVARLESGKRTISIADLLALSWALNVAPGFLLAGSFQDDHVPVHQTLRVPPTHMLRWIRGWTPLAGLDYRAYFENIPDDEWIEAYGPIAEQRNTAARSYASSENLLAMGAVEARPGTYEKLSPERKAEVDAERAERKKQLDASRRAKQPKRQRPRASDA